MANPLDYLSFELVPGEKAGGRLRVVTLSTCGFCKKGLRYLEAGGYEFRYADLDQMSPERRKEIKGELKSRYGNIPIFPVLIIDESEAINGFVEEKWEKRLARL